MDFFALLAPWRERNFGRDFVKYFKEKSLNRMAISICLTRFP